MRHPRGSGDPSRLGPRLREDDEKDVFQSGCKCSSSLSDLAKSPNFLEHSCH